MSGLFIACVVLMIVSVAFVVGIACYCKGRWDERQDWSDILGLPETADTRRHYTIEDIGSKPSRIPRKRWLNV